MSAKKCSRCEKTVYPTEELKCLDKIWHKICFKCQECGMTLNMKTYKGFNKLPYCNAHCPQAKHTSIADTPEIRRLAENTRIQSNVKYHEDFEKQKGKVTQVADDPETLRIRNTTKIISNVSYHGELDKKKEMEMKRQLVPEKNGATEPAGNANLSAPEPRSLDQPPHIAKDSPYSSKLSSTVIFTSQDGAVDHPPSRRIGSIADYDPINDNYGSIAGGARSMGAPPPTAYYNAPPPATIEAPPAVMPQQNYKPPQPTGLSFCAMYDYTAQDVDEVSFHEGDVIINCKPIDDGWMMGTVQRSGQEGMLPANYVAPIN